MFRSVNRIPAYAGVVLLFTAAAFAQSDRPADDPAGARKPARAESAARPRAGSTPQITSSSWEVWNNLVIAPGDVLYVDSGIDFSSSDTVRVTVRSSTGDLANLTMTAYWTVPGAGYFNSAEVVKGDGFIYNNVGGAVFNTFGTQFRIRLENTGGTTMTLVQMTAFARII